MSVPYHLSPDQLDAQQVREYVRFLMTRRKLGWSTVNVITAGLRFFYGEVLGRPEIPHSIPPRKTPRRLPEILSAEELERLFVAAANVKHRVLLMTTYAGGLRVSESSSASR